MKRCCTSSCFTLLLLGIAAAANLRSDPTITAGIGRLDPTVRSDTPIDYGSVPEYKLTLENHKGVQYFAPLTLNNQKLSAVYDTGSFDVMAMSKNCLVCKVPSSVLKYDSKSSVTFAKGDGYVGDHNFAGGLVEATMDFETVHVGDAGKDFVVKDMPFWQVVNTDMKVWLSNKAQFTGIVGLGHRDAIPGNNKQDSLLERTDTHRFALCLQKGQTNPGYITFNPKMHQPSISQLAATDPIPDPSSLSYTNSIFRRMPVIGKNHWAVQLDQVSTSAHGETSCSADKPCMAIIDSGTSLLGVPPSGVSMMKDFIGAIKEDCSNIDELPDLVLKLAGHNFVLPPSAYVIKWPNADGKTKCLPAFTDFDMPSSQGDVWVLGMPFLRNFYTVFDRAEPSIYIAEQGPNCEPAAQATAMVNSTGGFVAHRPHQEPSMVDVSEAMLPSWASAKFVGEI